MPVAEAALAYVAKKVLAELESELGDRARSWLKRDPQQLACRIALARTEARFAREHPDWRASLFDAHFLANAAAPVLARSLRGEADAAELAEAWATELGGETGARHLDAVTPAAADLLRIWREELRREEAFRAVLDSAALDRIADAGRPVDLERALLRARYPDLEDHVDWPSHRAARAPGALAGREWAFERLDALAAGSDAAYVRIVAEAGLGKTALATAIARRRSAPLFLFDERAGRVRADHCLKHLCAELIELHGLEHDHLPARDDPGMLARLLEEAPSPVWVVIDALDEAESLPLPDTLPDGAYVVVTHRPGDYGPAKRPGLAVHELRIRPGDDRQRDDVAAFLLDRVDDAGLRARLATASEGNFMYLAYVLEDLREGVLRQDELPHGLDDYYARMWDVIAAESGDWETLRRPVIELLAVAGEPVTSDWLAETTGRSGADIKSRALKPWRRFLSEDGDAWRIVHKSFRDFIEAGGEVDLPAAHARVAARVRDGEYASRHLSMHLRYAGDLDGLLALLEREDWRGAQLLADPSGALYRADVENGWEAAFEADQAALAAGETPAYLLAEVSLALSAAELLPRLPPELLLRLLETGEWGPGPVLTAAAAAPDAGKRVAALDLLLPVLEEPWRSHALDARGAAEAELIDDDVVTLDELTPEELPEALAAVVGIEDPVMRADILLVMATQIEGAPLDRALLDALRELYALEDVVVEDLAPRIPERLLGRVLEAVGALDDPVLRADALAELAPCLPPELVPAALAAADSLNDGERVFVRGLLAPDEAARALDEAAEADLYTRQVRLARLAAVVPDELVPRTFELAAGVDAALVELAPRLGTDLLRAACERVIEQRSAWLLAVLAPHLPEDLVCTAWDEAARWERAAEALAALARRLPDERLATALATVAEAAPRERDLVLAALAPRLPASLLASAVAAASAGGSNRAWGLAAIAPYVEGAAQAAVAIDPSAPTVAAVADHLQPREREARVRDALAGFDALDPEQRSPAAIALLPHVSGEQRAGLLEHVDVTMLSSGDIALVLDDLSDADVQRILDELEYGGDADDIIAALGPRLMGAERSPATVPLTEPEAPEEDTDLVELHRQIHERLRDGARAGEVVSALWQLAPRFGKLV